MFYRYSLTRDIDVEFPGALGFGFIRRVSRSNEAVFLAKVRQDNWPNFQIRGLNSHDYDEKYIIEYIEPVELNRAAVGLDIASESRRQEAASSALLSGEVRLSAPITLVQATGNPLQSFLILLPIYRTDDVAKTLDERDAAGFGWSYAPLVIDQVLAGLAINQTSTKLILSDVTNSAQAIHFLKHT